MTTVSDRTKPGKLQAWYKVVDIHTSNNQKEKEVARFTAYGDAYIYACDIANRPEYASDYNHGIHEIQIR